MYYKECGNQIADNSKFCASCGKPQGRTDSSQSENIFANTGQEKKSSFGWLFAILFGIIIAVFAIIALKGNYTSSEERHTNKSKGESSNKSYKVARIKYEVTGTAYSASITQTNQNGGTEQYNIKLPGSYEFSVPIRRGSFDYYHAMIMAQNNGSRGSITVTIYVNGKVFRTATSQGAYVIASADGAVEYGDVE